MRYPINQIKWFTLVELIVTIAILAILWTLAFLSLQWHIVNSRNTVRIDSLQKISSAVQRYLTSQKTILAISGEGREVSWASIAGSIILNGTYKAGVPQYRVLWLPEDWFKDPQTQDDYLIGVTSLLSGKSYEIATTIESDGLTHAQVVWLWTPRWVSSINGTAKVWDTTFVITSPTDIGKFYPLDTVEWPWIPIGTTIQEVSADGQSIILSNAFTSTGSQMNLALLETAGLISSYDDSAVPVIDFGTALPYALSK